MPISGRKESNGHSIIITNICDSGDRKSIQSGSALQQDHQNDTSPFTVPDIGEYSPVKEHNIAQTFTQKVQKQTSYGTEDPQSGKESLETSQNMNHFQNLTLIKELADSLAVKKDRSTSKDKPEPVQKGAQQSKPMNVNIQILNSLKTGYGFLPNFNSPNNAATRAGQTQSNLLRQSFTKSKNKTQDTGTFSLGPPTHKPSHLQTIHTQGSSSRATKSRAKSSNPRRVRTKEYTRPGTVQPFGVGVEYETHDKPKTPAHVANKDPQSRSSTMIGQFIQQPIKEIHFRNNSMPLHVEHAYTMQPNAKIQFNSLSLYGRYSKVMNSQKSGDSKKSPTFKRNKKSKRSPPAEEVQELDTERSPGTRADSILKNVEKPFPVGAVIKKKPKVEQVKSNSIKHSLSPSKHDLSFSGNGLTHQPSKRSSYNGSVVKMNKAGVPRKAPVEARRLAKLRPAQSPSQLAQTGEIGLPRQIIEQRQYKGIFGMGQPAGFYVVENEHLATDKDKETTSDTSCSNLVHKVEKMMNIHNITMQQPVPNASPKRSQQDVDSSIQGEIQRSSTQEFREAEDDSKLEMIRLAEQRRTADESAQARDSQMRARVLSATDDGMLNTNQTEIDKSMKTGGTLHGNFSGSNIMISNVNSARPDKDIKDLKEMKRMNTIQTNHSALEVPEEQPEPQTSRPQTSNKDAIKTSLSKVAITEAESLTVADPTLTSQVKDTNQSSFAKSKKQKFRLELGSINTQLEYRNVSVKDIQRMSQTAKGSDYSASQIASLQAKIELGRSCLDYSLQNTTDSATSRKVRSKAEEEADCTDVGVGTSPLVKGEDEDELFFRSQVEAQAIQDLLGQSNKTPKKENARGPVDKTNSNEVSSERVLDTLEVTASDPDVLLELQSGETLIKPITASVEHSPSVIGMIQDQIRQAKELKAQQQLLKKRQLEAFQQQMQQLAKVQDAMERKALLPKTIKDLAKRGQRIIYKSVDGTKKIINPNQTEVQDVKGMTLQGFHIESLAQKYNTMLMQSTPFNRSTEVQSRQVTDRSLVEMLAKPQEGEATFTSAFKQVVDRRKEFKNIKVDSLPLDDTGDGYVKKSTSVRSLKSNNLKVEKPNSDDAETVYISSNMRISQQNPLLSKQRPNTRGLLESTKPGQFKMSVDSGAFKGSKLSQITKVQANSVVDPQSATNSQAGDGSTSKMVISVRQSHFNKKRSTQNFSIADPLNNESELAPRKPPKVEQIDTPEDTVHTHQAESFQDTSVTLKIPSKKSGFNKYFSVTQNPLSIKQGPKPKPSSDAVYPAFGQNVHNLIANKLWSADRPQRLNSALEVEVPSSQQRGHTISPISDSQSNFDSNFGSRKHSRLPPVQQQAITSTSRTAHIPTTFSNHTKTIDDSAQVSLQKVPSPVANILVKRNSQEQESVPFYRTQPATIGETLQSMNSNTFSRQSIASRHSGVSRPSTSETTKRRRNLNLNPRLQYQSNMQKYKNISQRQSTMKRTSNLGVKQAVTTKNQVKNPFFDQMSKKMSAVFSQSKIDDDRPPTKSQVFKQLQIQENDPTDTDLSPTAYRNLRSLSSSHWSLFQKKKTQVESQTCKNKRKQPFMLVKQQPSFNFKSVNQTISYLGQSVGGDTVMLHDEASVHNIEPAFTVNTPQYIYDYSAMVKPQTAQGSSRSNNPLVTKSQKAYQSMVSSKKKDPQVIAVQNLVKGDVSDKSIVKTQTLDISDGDKSVQHTKMMGEDLQEVESKSGIITAQLSGESRSQVTTPQVVDQITPQVVFNQPKRPLQAYAYQSKHQSDLNLTSQRLSRAASNRTSKQKLTKRPKKK